MKFPQCYVYLSVAYVSICTSPFPLATMAPKALPKHPRRGLLCLFACFHNTARAPPSKRTNFPDNNASLTHHHRTAWERKFRLTSVMIVWIVANGVPLGVRISDGSISIHPRAIGLHLSLCMVSNFRFLSKLHVIQIFFRWGNVSRQNLTPWKFWFFCRRKLDLLNYPFFPQSSRKKCCSLNRPIQNVWNFSIFQYQNLCRNAKDSRKKSEIYINSIIIEIFMC